MKKLILILLFFIAFPVFSQDYTGEWPYGSEFTATATPNEGWQFVNWTDSDGTVVSTENPYTFIVTGDVDLTANFQRLNFIIQIQVNPEGSGEVEGAGVHPADSEVMLRAIPYDNYEFKNFQDKLTGDKFAQNPLFVIADMDRDYMANFTYAGYPGGNNVWYFLIIALIISILLITNINNKWKQRA